ncbi:Uncharacterised protein [Intestinibacter bartlettii]|nr:Uncharacterised protein [Intestinibacter bartlettii]
MMYDYGELQNQLLELYDTQVDNLKNVQIRCDLILIGATMELEKNGIKKDSEYYKKLVELIRIISEALNEIGEYIGNGINVIINDEILDRTKLKSDFIELMNAHDSTSFKFLKNMNEILDKCK